VYLSLRFDVDAASADAWSDALLEAGALSVDVSDPHAGAPSEVAVYAEPGSATRWWPLSRIAALFPAAADAEAALDQAARMLGVGLPPAERGRVAEQDWVRVTQAQFGPIRIEDDLWIVPTWSTPPAPDATNLVLDPGLAFGTGSHPTTRLCLQWLRQALRGGERVLDYGCGSGILAIGAARLGAADVRGTDIDPQAIDASRANAAANGIAATFALPDAIDPAPADVVVANILANPLIVLAPLLAARTRAGGLVALSGILVDQADDVVAAYAPWFTLAAWRTADGWVLLAGARHS
jgi:ribosomal protein L11 methyltransferase